MTNGFFVPVDDERPATGVSDALDFVGENCLHLGGLDRLVVAPAPDRLADARRRGEAEIGLNENVLEIVERGGVELALGENVGDAARDRRGRARQPGG